VTKITGADHMDPLDPGGRVDVLEVEIACRGAGKFRMNVKIGGDLHGRPPAGSALLRDEEFACQNPVNTLYV